MTQSLYDQIGSAPAVEAAVDLFYRKVLTDDSISHFFDAADMGEQRAKQKAFLTMVLGGPHAYTGKDLRAAHAPLVEKGLDDTRFDAVAGHLQASLEEMGVSAALIAEVMTVAASTRDDVLDR